MTLNTAARLYLTELANYLYGLQEGKPTDGFRDKVEEARREHRARHAEAQMIVPDAVLAAAGEVSRRLGTLYEVLKRIDRGGPEAGETIEEADEMRLKAWGPLANMRAVMRHDLGITEQRRTSAPGSGGRPAFDRHGRTASRPQREVGLRDDRINGV